MRVVDLDRDMRDVFPAGTTPDSDYLFEQMMSRTLDLAAPTPGGLVLDVASGLGQDARALAGRGARAVAAEPSARMSALARMADDGMPGPAHVRGWGDALPFADGSFDSVICKGALDHFDSPRTAIAEMARVTRTGGSVVLAIANFDSLSCRAARALDAWREGALGRLRPRGRRPYDVPHDHFTRYELSLMLQQAREHLALERVEGISLCWGLPAWSRALGRLPKTLVGWALAGLGRMARRWPALSDVVLLAGTPRT